MSVKIRHPVPSDIEIAQAAKLRPIQDIAEDAGLKAGELVGQVSRLLGAGGGGAPHLAFGGGREAEKIPAALASVKGWVEGKIK